MSRDLKQIKVTHSVSTCRDKTFQDSQATEHVCSLPGRHRGEHWCVCGEVWPKVQTNLPFEVTEPVNHE